MNREEVYQEFCSRISEELWGIWQDGYCQGEKDALKRVSEQDEEMLRIEKEKAYNQGWQDGISLLNNASGLAPRAAAKKMAGYDIQKTNTDKFVEVFGFKPKNIYIQPYGNACVKGDDCKLYCDMQTTKHCEWWDQVYKEIEDHG